MKEVGIHKKEEISLESILKEVRRRSYGKAGAISCFIGIVREEGLYGGKVRYLEYEAHDKLVEDQLRKIRDELMKKYGLVEMMIHHIIDRVYVGEDTIYVVAAGKHRAEVFRSIEEAMNRIKKEVAIWKKEFTEKESYWVGATE